MRRPLLSGRHGMRADHKLRRVDDLAHRSDVGANWDKLVLPKLQRNLLREIAIHGRQRSKV
jgi:hypothetical protein